MANLKLSSSTKIKANGSIGKAVYEYALFAVMALVMFVMPFYRGMYFRINFIPEIAVISVLFLGLTVMMWKYRESGIVENYMDAVLLALSAAYMLSIISGVSKMNSLDGALKYIAAFMLYKLVYQLTKQEKLRVLITIAIVVSGFVIALFSMLGSAGLIEMNGVFGFGERLCGPYQYPNSTASVLAAVYMLSILLLIGQDKIFIRTAYLLSSGTMILAFLATKSRGGMLVLLLSWLVAMILLKGKDRLYLLMYSLASLAPAVALYSKVFNTFIEKKGFISLYAIFVVLVLVMQGIVEVVRKFIGRINDRTSNKIIIALIIAAFGLMFIVLNTLAPLELSKDRPNSNYEVYSTEAGRTYTAEFVAAGLEKEAGSLAVNINSVDSTRQRTALSAQQYTAGAEQKNTFEFSTPENMMYLTVDFVNSSPDKGITVKEFVIKDKVTGAVVEKLRLKYKYLPYDIGMRINQINLTTESSSERFVFVKDGLNMFKDHFLTGTGSKGWGILYTKYQSYGYNSAEAHNFYLQTAIESGLLGLAALAGLLVCFAIISVKLYFAKRENSYSTIGMIALAFTLLAHALIDFDFSLYAILLLMYISIGWLASTAHENNILKLNFKYHKASNYAAGLIAAVVAVFTITMYTGILAGEKGANSIQADVNKAKVYYQSALGKSFYNTDYIVDYSQILSQEVLKSKDKAVIEEIHKNYKKVEALEPYAIKYYSVILNFYMNYGYIEDANNLAERLIEIQPLNPASYGTKANINADLIGYYTARGEYKEALECADRIIAIEQQYSAANSKTLQHFELEQQTKEIIAEAKGKRGQIEQLVEKSKS